MKFRPLAGKKKRSEAQKKAIEKAKRENSLLFIPNALDEVAHYEMEKHFRLSKFKRKRCSNRDE